MVNRDEFCVGKLYYHCGWIFGKYPVPVISAYVLDRFEEDGLYFISPEELNARGPLAKLSEEDQSAIKNVLAINGGLFVPYSELDGFFRTAPEAIEFLKRSFADPALGDLL